jgi:hypothetical protein
VAAFYYGRQNKWWLAGIMGGCAALIKQPGVFLILPLAYMYWRQYITYRTKRGHILFIKKLEWAWLLFIPITAFGYLTYRYLLLSTPLGGATDLGAGEELTVPGVPLIRALLAIPSTGAFFAANLLDITFALLMVGLVTALVLRSRSKTFSLYAVPVALISLCVTYNGTQFIRPEIDMPRRILIIFPIFVYLAVALPSRRAFRYFTVASIVGYLFLTGLFINWFFVA